MSDTSTVVAMGITATLVNVYGSVRKNKNTLTAIMGSFIVTFMLLVVAETRASKIATAFAFTFLVSSLALNADDLFKFVGTMVGDSKTLEARTQNAKNVANGVYDHVDSWDRSRSVDNKSNTDSWNR